MKKLTVYSDKSFLISPGVVTLRFNDKEIIQEIDVTNLSEEQIEELKMKLTNSS